MVLKTNRTFWVAERGLATQIEHAVSPDVYFSDEDFGPNLNWYEVTVKDRGDEAKWVAARNNQLHSRWTPNQDEEEKKYYKMIDNLADSVMDKLEVPRRA